MTDKNGSVVLNGRENTRKAMRLVLENGAVFQGQAFGALDVVRRLAGEAVRKLAGQQFIQNYA